MSDRVKDSIEIMPGSGINSSNVKRFKTEGFPSVHLSAIRKIGSPTSLFSQQVAGVSDPEEIARVIEVLS